MNRGTLNLGNAFTAGNGIESDTNLTLAPGQYVAFNGQRFNNQATMTLNGPTLDGNGPITNAAGQLMSGFASVFGTGGFINLGQFTQSGGNLAIWNTGPNSNVGQMDLQAPNQLQLGVATVTLTNSGTFNLNGATVSGAGQIANAAAGVISGRGTILTGLNNGGTITLSDGQLNTPSFANTGSITPAGPSAVISGGNIVNQGTIDGSGKVNNNVANTGAIEPIGGTLILTGAVFNNAGGLVTATIGNKLLLTQGLGTNGGLISLTGETIDTNHTSLTNSGTISGYGVLRTGGLTNTSQITLTGGTTTIDGPVTNNSGARIDVRYSSAVFNSPVTNNAGAIFKTTAASVSFVAPFTNNGIYNSDPATNTFTDLTVGADGALVGGEGDRFIVTRDLINNSTLSNLWDTATATLELAGGANHTLTTSGEDRGADYSGFVNNFGWGTIQLDASDSLTLAPGGAIYAEVFSLESGLSQLDAITGNGSNIYYDPAQPANAYLADQSYSLAGGGMLAPVPEPWSVGLVGLGALMLTRSRRR